MEGTGHTSTSGSDVAQLSSLTLGAVSTVLFLGQALGDAVMTVAALVGVIAGGAAAIWSARNKAALAAASTSAEAWERERNAEHARAVRAEEGYIVLQSQLAELQGRTDLTSLTGVIEATTKQLARDHALMIDEIRALARATSSNTTALEYLARFVLPSVMADPKLTLEDVHEPGPDPS